MEVGRVEFTLELGCLEVGDKSTERWKGAGSRLTVLQRRNIVGERRRDFLEEMIRERKKEIFAI